MSLADRAYKILDALRMRRRGIHRHMRVFSHSTVSERVLLNELAMMLPVGARALEIGSHIGSSALFLAAGLERREGHLYCVDTWMNQTMPDGEKDTFAQFSANTTPYSDIITPVRKMSYDVLPEDFGGGPLDLAFIDGDHSAEGVQRDFDLLAPWIREGGLLAFHDTGNPDYPGVSQTVGRALVSGAWQPYRIADTLAVIRKATGKSATK